MLPTGRILFPILLLFLASCGGTESSAPARPPLFDLPTLAGEPPAAVDAALGTPTSVTPIKNIPEQMPGEFRDYQLPGVPDPATVRFHRDRAVFFTVFLPQPEPSAEAALQRVGIDVTGSPDTRAPLAEWWRSGTFGGKRFVKVGALKGMGGRGDGYDMVQAELQ